MNQRKIFLLNHGLANGGTDTFCVNLLKGLDRSKYVVGMIMAVNPDSQPQFREDEVREMGIPVFKTSDLGGIRQILLHCHRLYKILKREKPDVFHANMDLFNGFNMFVAWMAGVPVRVCHSHTSKSQYEEKSGKHIIVNLYRVMMRQMIWLFSNRRCACSETAAAYLFTSKWRLDSNSYIIYNGIDLNEFYHKINVGEKKKSLNLAANKHYLVTVGRLSKEKNPFFIVDIMEGICKKRNDIELIWVGTGEMGHMIRKRISEKGIEEKIHFLGARRDVPDLLKCGEAFLMPSLFEGFGIAALEAQAAGLACLVSDTVTQEVDVGKCKFLSIDNPDLWIKELLNIVDGNDGMQINEEKIRMFDRDYMLHSLEKVYRV